MINFNVPPYIGKEQDYIKQAIESHKICGDGEFTKKCSAWLEDRFKAQKALLTTSGTTNAVIVGNPALNITKEILEGLNSEYVKSRNSSTKDE